MANNYSLLSVPLLRAEAKKKGIAWIKPSYMRKTDFVAVLESADSLAEAGGKIVSYPSAISSLTISKLKEELAVLRVDWVYPSKVNKPKLVALLHRLKKDDWQPSTRKEREPDHRPKPRFWEGGDDGMVYGGWRHTKWGILHGEFGGCNTFGGNRDRRSWGRY